VRKKEQETKAGSKAIIFDLGGVIVHVDHMRYADTFAGLCGQPAREIRDFICLELHPSYNSGQMAPQQFFETVETRFGLGIPFDEFAAIYADIFELNEETAGLLQRLKRKYPLCLLSNTDPLHWEYELRKFEILSVFDHLVLSFAVDCAKPDPEIYRRALALCDVQPAQAVFIDDVPEYVEGAKAVGLNAIRFLSAAQVERDLKRLGVDVPTR